MKLRPVVDFINVQRTAFALVEIAESVRTQSSHQYLFTLLGSTSVKAVHRTLMKSTPGVHNLNLIRAKKKFFTYPKAKVNRL